MIMKTIVKLSAALLLLSFTACNGGKLKEAEEQNSRLRGDLAETLATQDSLLILVNDISDGMNQIKEIEKIIAVPGALNGENESRRQQLRADMIAIQQALQARRERLAQLEKKLSGMQSENSTLQKTIKNLKAQIAEQQTGMATLTEQLAAANIRIEELDNTVTTLNQAVDTLSMGLANETSKREEAENRATQNENRLNMCYYAIGSKDNLKKAKILESGFLRSTKIMKGDYDDSYFTLGDKRTLSEIPLHSNKAKVLTDQPATSYEIVDQNGQKVLRITNPDLFWKKSDYLVVQVD